MPLLIVGEVIVDFTLTGPNEENKMRLGGIAHSARGLWALGRTFEAAVFLPRYLEAAVRKYFHELGCVRLEVMGYVEGAPNVTIIHDVRETDDQGYDFLLRDEKTIEVVQEADRAWLNQFEDVFLIPGQFDLAHLVSIVPNARLHLDVAYDVGSIDELNAYANQIHSVFISTSSKLFLDIHEEFPGTEYNAFLPLSPAVCVIKENRGGSRVYDYSTQQEYSAPAQLGTTVNSVGVGDVYDVAFFVFSDRGCEEAAYRASYVSSAYAQTTVPNLLRQSVERSSGLKWSTIKSLGGVALSWAARRTCDIYLAAPDFANADRWAIDKAISALEYHNFSVRRPVQENGELPSDSDIHDLKSTYREDLSLLDKCGLVFAVPTGRDPGTLVEVGYALAKGMPVVVFDPNRECANTMVIAGAHPYSTDLEECITGVYTIVAELVSK